MSSVNANSVCALVSVVVLSQDVTHGQVYVRQAVGGSSHYTHFNKNTPNDTAGLYMSSHRESLVNFGTVLHIIIHHVVFTQWTVPS